MQSPRVQTVRDRLRTETRAAHDALDLAMSALDLGCRRDYARFLAIQLAAREPVEAWCAETAPSALHPPAQLALIRADLTALGRPCPRAGTHGTPLPTDLDPLAVAWVIAGSSLGNRAMLADMERQDGQDMPTAFLSDPAMAAFWKRLKPRLDAPTDPERIDRMISSARSVFASFLAHAGRQLDRIAA